MTNLFKRLVLKISGICRSSSTKSSGYTLVELVAVVGVSGIVATGIYQTILLQRRAAWVQEISEYVNFEREQLSVFARRRLSSLLKQAPTMSNGVFTFGPNLGSNAKVVITVTCESTAGDPILKMITNLGPSSAPVEVTNAACKSCTSGASRARITITEYNDNNVIISTKKFPAKDIATSVTPGKSAEGLSTNICFSTPTCSSGRCRLHAEIIQSYMKFQAGSGGSFDSTNAIDIAREVITVEGPEQLGSDITILPPK